MWGGGMRVILGLVFLALLSWPVNALAGCSTTTIANPDGTLTICTTCCTAGNCHTYCS